MKLLQNALIKKYNELLLTIPGMPVCVKAFYVQKAKELKKQIQEVA